MIASMPHAPSLAALHASFLAIIPHIERHGRLYFRGLKSADAREEAVQEMVALSWKCFLSLVRRGKDVTRFPTALAGYAARAVRNGRRLCGRETAQDVLSARAQQRHGFAVRPLPQQSRLRNVVAATLRNNLQTSPDDQAV